jgi:hypothetical protein
MSKLLELFNGSDYARLTSVGVNNGTTATVSVRKQSNTDAAIRQETAVNFIDPLKTVQDEFTVNEATNALSTTGISKAVEAKNTKFTTAALGTYETRSADPKLIYINGDTSKSFQRYVAPSSEATANSNYAAKNSTAKGIVLGYTPA